MNKKLAALTAIILLATPVLTQFHITTDNSATKYTTHGAKITLEDKDWAKLGNKTLEIWIEDQQGLPIQQIHRYTNKETNKPVNYEVLPYNQTRVINFNIDEKYQKNAEYTIHAAVQSTQEETTANFTVDRIKQPDILGDIIMVLTNPANIMLILGLIVISLIFTVFIGAAWKTGRLI